MDEVLNNTDSDDAGDGNNNNTNNNNTLGMQHQQHEQLYTPNRTLSNKHDSIPRQVDNITLQSPTNLRRKIKPSADSAKSSTKNMAKNSTKQLGTALGALGQLVAGSSPKGGGSKNKNEFFPTYDVESYSDVQHMKLNSNPTNTNNPYNNDHNFDNDDEDTSLDHPTTNTGAAQPARSRILTNTTSTNSSYDNSAIYNSNDHSSSGGQQYFTKLRRSYENIKGKLFTSTHSLRSSSSNNKGQNYDHGDNENDIEQDIRESQSILLASSGDSLDLDLLYTTAGHSTGKRGTKKLSKMSKNSGTANKQAYTSAAVPGEPFSKKLLVGEPAYPSSSSSKNSTPRRAITTPRIR